MELILKNYPQVIVELIQNKSIINNFSIHEIEVFEYNGYTNFFNKNVLFLKIEGYYNKPFESIFLSSKKNLVKLIKKNTEIKVLSGKRKTIYERDDFKCLKCGENNIKKLTLDHIIPISKGGKSNNENLQTLCKKCNGEKGNKNCDDYRKKIKQAPRC